MRKKQVSYAGLTFKCSQLEEEISYYYVPILRIQFQAFTLLSVLIFLLALTDYQVNGNEGVILCVCLLLSIIITQALFYQIKKPVHYLMMPINSLFISLLLFYVFSNESQAISHLYVKEFALISLFLLDTQKFYINILNLAAMKVAEVLLFDETADTISDKVFSIQYGASILFILTIMYMKLRFIRYLFADSEIGRDWIDIVNSGLTQRVFITRYNGQTGKLELFNCNQACQKDIYKDQNAQKFELQECFNQYLLNFKININDCQIYKPPMELIDKKNMIDLKQYLVNRHIFMTEQFQSKLSITRFSDNGSLNQVPSSQKIIRQRNNSGQSILKGSGRRRRSSSANKMESIQVHYHDEKSNCHKVYKMKIDQFGVSSSPQLIVILDDESHTQELIRHKQEKQVIETFLFSLMQNIQEKLRYGIWGVENGFLQSVKVENYMLINQVYCIFDYFIIKAKKLRNNFSQAINKKIQKILNVESFCWQTLMNELKDLFSDLEIISDQDLNKESLYITQDRRKVKQVLIALLSLSQYRAVDDYQLKISRIKKNEWNALLLTVSFQTELNPRDYKKEFYKYLNGNSIDLLNQIEEEVIKETVMLIGPYQINEDITESGLVQISFAFFEDLEVIYDNVSVAIHTQVTQGGREDTQIRKVQTPQNQQQIAANFNNYIARVKERQKRSEKKIVNMETSSKSKQNGEENSNSNEEDEENVSGEIINSEQKNNQIYSLDNEDFLQTSMNSIEKVQSLPEATSPKKMIQLTNPSLTQTSRVPLLPVNNRTNTIIISNPLQQKSNLMRSSTLTLNTKFASNNRTPQSAKTNKNNTQGFGFSKTKVEDDVDITSKMQSSIYTQTLISTHKNSQHNSHISKKESLQQIKQSTTAPIMIDKANLSLCKQLSENKIDFINSPKMQQLTTPKSKQLINQYTYFGKSYSKFKKQDTNYLPAEIIKETSNEQNNHMLSARQVGYDEVEFNDNQRYNNTNSLNPHQPEKFNFSFKGPCDQKTDLTSPNLPNLQMKNSKLGDTSFVTNGHRNSMILYSNNKPQSRDDISIQIKKSMDIIQTKNIIERGFEDDIVSINLPKQQ